ncbi:MAG TPA: peptidoglycan -binding protein, partial [Acetobacteraceae bacterium]|nr:peptidoglycan -binding protein [Acetobacteraceae bacterium]
QFFLSAALSGRSKALDKVTQQLADVSNMLSLEKGHETTLEQSVAQLTAQLASSQSQSAGLSSELAQLEDRVKQTLAERDALQTKLTSATQLVQANSERIQQLQGKVAQTQSERDALQAKLTGATQLAQTNSSRAAQLQGQLADLQQQLADMKKQAAELDKTVAADKDTIQAKLSDLAKLAEQTRALQALRDQLETQAETAAAKAMTEQQRRQAVEAQLAKERDLGSSAAAQLALLNRQVDNLKSQLTAVAQALDLAQAKGRDKDVQIANLGQQLNIALAAKVQELQSYRSEFFGDLRRILADKPGIRVVGDRFVIQSDVLFPVGNAELSPDGVVQMVKLAETIKQIAGQIPPKIPWVLDVDGYADKQPINGGHFASNWELSAARAISVVKLLINEGVPAEHLSATAYSDNHPLDSGDTQDAYARNRRIELRLTNYATAATDNQG